MTATLRLRGAHQSLSRGSCHVTQKSLPQSTSQTLVLGEEGGSEGPRGSNEVALSASTS